ncbi:unnamed protein product [Clonostachys byssicola]|uniref:NACHT domain-containing protein n=1 Tax=Clonostachys byssicola TaxID=160290 RepID=A0A9N9UK31_9HYPO|nr:unnamed protein product [Clonostachys byssicola]
MSNNMGTFIITIVTQSTFGDNAAILGGITNVLISDSLPTAGGATYDSFAERHNATCLANTRTDLLNQIQGRLESEMSEFIIIWLKGMAGTGKSTIARTIAKWLREAGDHNTLNVNFFFKEGDRDRGHAQLFFTTIAFQLKTLDSDLGSLIDSATKADPGIHHKGLEEQFDKLIMQPLRAVQKSMIITIVVDALDECDDGNLIVTLLAQLSEIPSLTIRIFLTSRPEVPFRLVFKKLTCQYQDISLHEIPHSVIKQDLTTFFIHALGEIRDKQNNIRLHDDQLPPDWPGPENIRLLVEMASPLFISASTICRFIDSNSIPPEEQLHKILACRHTIQLEGVYAPILSQLLCNVTKNDQRGVVENFKKVVGSVVSLFETLSANSLSALLGVRRRKVDPILCQLHSVLIVPSDPDAPIEMLHKSFRDYLFSKGKSGQKPHQFWVDSRKSHERIASRCLKILENSLTRIFSRLTSLRTYLGDITNEVRDLIPSHVQYACRNWIYHLNHANWTLRIEAQVESFFENHFLHWAETLLFIESHRPQTMEQLAYVSLSSY